MTKFIDPKDQFIENVSQCLDIVQLSLNQWTADGKGIHGYPAMILLMTVIDAMGHNIPKAKRQTLGIDMDLGILAYPGSDFGIFPNQIKNLLDWYRNKLIHMGLMAKGVSLRGEPHNKPFEFASNGQLNEVFVLPLYERVRKFWDDTDRDLFDSPKVSGPSIPADLLNSTLLSKSSSMPDSKTPAPSGVAVSGVVR
jgi:hypothetical protein